jgi:hypothetical protein
MLRETETDRVDKHIHPWVLRLLERTRPLRRESYPLLHAPQGIHGGGGDREAGGGRAAAGPARPAGRIGAPRHCNAAGGRRNIKTDAASERRRDAYLGRGRWRGPRSRGRGGA